MTVADVIVSEPLPPACFSCSSPDLWLPGYPSIGLWNSIIHCMKTNIQERCCINLTPRVHRSIWFQFHSLRGFHCIDFVCISLGSCEEWFTHSTWCSLIGTSPREQLSKLCNVGEKPDCSTCSIFYVSAWMHRNPGCQTALNILYTVNTREYNNAQSTC